MIELLKTTPEQVHMLHGDGPAFEARWGLRVEPGYLEFPEALGYVLARVEQEPEATMNWWLPFLAVHRDESAVVGLGGYKGPPVNGAIEIGYGIAPAYRNQGLATVMTTLLLLDTRRYPEITLVIAHTPALDNASTRVLAKCGFTKVGEVEDPEDGPLWRWERPVPSAGTG